MNIFLLSNPIFSGHSALFYVLVGVGDKTGLDSSDSYLDLKTLQTFTSYYKGLSMCLSTVFSEQEKADFLATQPDVITVYKAIRYRTVELQGVIRDGWYALFRRLPVKEGEQKAKAVEVYSEDEPRTPYNTGFHVCLSKCAVSFLLTGIEDSEAVIECTVKKSDVTAVGLQNRLVCLVCSKITHPKLPEPLSFDSWGRVVSNKNGDKDNE